MQKQPRKYPRGIRFINDPARKMPWAYVRTIAGKRVHTFFSSFEAALKGKAAAEMAMKTGADGRKVFDAKMQREYDAAYSVIRRENAEATLLDVVMFWQEHADLWRVKKIAVAAVAQEVLDNLTKTGCTNAHFQKTRWSFRLFCDAFAERELSTLRSRELTEWLLSMRDRFPSQATVATIRRAVSYLFSRAVALGYLTTAPTFDLTLFKKEATAPVLTLSVAETERFLRAAEATAPRFVANLALRFFCGLRSAEAARMRWEWIDEARKRIVVPASICKTRDDWVLQCPLLPETVFRWLATVPESEKQGSVPAPSHAEENDIVKAAGLAWKRNALRHTFCTMHVSLYDSADKTALLLKHKSTAMLYKHYLAKLVPREEAEAYFALSPKAARLTS